MTLESRAAKMASRARRVNGGWCNGIWRCRRLQAVEWRRRWPIGDLHRTDIGGKADIKRASLKRADPWGAPARKAPIAARRSYRLYPSE